MLEYQVEARYGYSAVELFKDGSLVRTVATGLTRRAAQQMANELTLAYGAGRTDGIVEFKRSIGVDTEVSADAVREAIVEFYFTN